MTGKDKHGVKAYLGNATLPRPLFRATGLF